MCFLKIVVTHSISFIIYFRNNSNEKGDELNMAKKNCSTIVIDKKGTSTLEISSSSLLIALKVKSYKSNSLEISKKPTATQIERQEYKSRYNNEHR